MTFVALGAPAQNEGDGQSAGRARGRDRAQEKQAWFMSGRAPVGESAADLVRRAWRQKQEMRAQRGQAAGREGRPAETSRFLQLQWTSLGPKPIDSDPTLFQSYGFVSGRVTSVAVDQKDVTGNTVYIGSANGGVWKSTNAAAADAATVTWQPLTDDQPSLAIGALAIQPGVNGNVILAGTGEANNASSSYYGMGFLRSTDAGQSWTLISSANNGARPLRGLSFSRIAFHTGNPDVVVAAAGSSNGEMNGADIQAEAGHGIYVSSDAGLSWSYAAIQDSGVNIQASAVTDIVFNAVHNKFYAAVRGHGFYESTNGQTWTRMAQQPGGLPAANCPAVTNAGTCPMVRGRLAVRAQSGEVFTAWVDAANTLSLYKLSSNGGAWQAMGQTGIASCGDPGPDAGCGAQQGNYNLTLQAVPNGIVTDLYFGAVNLFKCTLLPQDALCTASGAWKNLTHAYGCSPLGAPAHVHPGHHAIDFSVAAPERVYFATDGGAYRSLAGHAMNSSSCGTANAFDNLNSTLGPLSQFISLAQPVGEVGILLGGVLANGSPVFSALDAGASGSLWRAANLGDGGYSAIDPAAASVFYTSFPAGESATIQRCTSGTNCRQNTWTTVADTATFSGDASAFFLPYMLDPKNPATLLAGTCRVWRGPAAGGGFTPLSGILAAGGASICSGGTTSGETKIRSLAAGGAIATSGSAKVIYAGMVGRAGGAAGRLFVTTDSDAGPTSWNDRTGGINPSEYDISSIAISPLDATGHTAYVGVMGFGVAHIFKTTNAGLSWTNKSGNLPDVPVNSLAVDPANSALLYAGTDIGVFVSADDGATWSELGTGLPNVPVVRLLTFVSGNIRRLRAATFGRGVWEIELPVAAVKISESTLTLNPTVVGRTSPPRSFTLTNDSTAPITFSGIFSTGAFTLQHECPLTLPVGSSCPLQTTFRPQSAGLHQGTVQVDYDSGSKTVNLSATAVDFSLTLSRTTRPSRHGGGAAAVLEGAASFEVVLQTSGPGDADVIVSCHIPAAVARCGVMPETVAISERPAVVRVLLEREEAVRRPQRLSKIKSYRSMTYKAIIKIVSGTVQRVMEVPFEIR